MSYANAPIHAATEPRRERNARILPHKKYGRLYRYEIVRGVKTSAFEKCQGRFGSKADYIYNWLTMASLEDIVRKQKPGAQFVVSAQMLKLTPQDFDALAHAWLDDGGPGFNVIGMPHRVVINGIFLISWITVIRTTSPP